jgi:aminopeptidase
MNAVEAAKTALANTRDATIGETTLIFCDKEKKDIGELFSRAMIDLGLWTRLVVMETTNEPRRKLDDRMKELITGNKPDLYVNLFRNMDEETAYRIQFNKLERQKTSRICHCPGVTMEMFTEGAATLTEEEYKSMFSFGENLKESLKGTKKVHITSPKGADFTFKVDREFTVEYGGNLPCGEVMLMPPIGDSFEGKLVCTSGGAGRLYRETPVEITSNKGLAGKVTCSDKQIKKRIEEELNRDPGSRYLGEFAFGINSKARLVDEFLEAEKVVGTIHMAFGGSYFPTKTHMDLLIENPTITISKTDEKPFIVMEEGKFKVP